MDKCKRQADQPETVRISAYVDIVGEGMTCQKCGSENIVPDVEYDGGHRRPYLKCLMCGREYKNALSNNDNPVIDKQENTEPAFETIEESEKKMETIEKKIKGTHKPCLNHPDKYAVKDGLCTKCYREKTGLVYKSKKIQPEIKKEDEVMVVKLCTDCRYCDIPNGQQPYRSCDDDGKNWQEKEPVSRSGAVIESSSLVIKEVLRTIEITDGDNTVEIMFENGELEAVKLDGSIIEKITTKELIFLGRVGEEIERLAKK